MSAFVAFNSYCIKPRTSNVSACSCTPPPIPSRSESLADSQLAAPPMPLHTLHMSFCRFAICSGSARLYFASLRCSFAHPSHARTLALAALLTRLLAHKSHSICWRNEIFFSVSGGSRQNQRQPAAIFARFVIIYSVRVYNVPNGRFVPKFYSSFSALFSRKWFNKNCLSFVYLHLRTLNALRRVFNYNLLLFYLYV